MPTRSGLAAVYVGKLHCHPMPAFHCGLPVPVGLDGGQQVQELEGPNLACHGLLGLVWGGFWVAVWTYYFCYPLANGFCDEPHHE